MVLRRVLDRFLAEADLGARVARDPVSLVRAYADPADREVVGLVVASVAYGRASSIIDAARALLAPLGPRPARAIASPEVRASLEGFVYRFQRGLDFPEFFRAIAEVRAAHGSLAAAFVAELSSTPGDYIGTLDRWVLALRARAGAERSRGLRFLLPRADGTGAAKRLCLYLRWMIRPDDGVDTGAWQALAPGRLSPRHLVMPVDTHIERIGRYVGLTDRRTGGLEMAREITASLAALRPEDPLAYDLALCHLGISGACRRRRELEACRRCPIRSVCRLGRPPRGWADIAEERALEAPARDDPTDGTAPR